MSRPAGAAITELMKALPELQPMARLWSRDPEGAADLIQDTLERALQRLDRYRAGTNAGAWLRAIMYHLAVDRSRQQRREWSFRKRYASEPAEVHVIPEVDKPPPPREPPSDIGAIRRTAERLREPLRGTFLLWLDERLSYKELSQRQGISLNTVATRLLRARRQIRLLAW